MNIFGGGLIVSVALACASMQALAQSDPTGRPASNPLEHVTAPQEKSHDDLQSFTLEKPASERGKNVTELTSLSGSSAGAASLLPPATDLLRYGMGFQYGLQTGAGFGLTADGKMSGVGVNMNSRISPLGSNLHLDSGRLMLLDRERGWAGEVGDVVSDVYGLTRGVRYAWRGQSSRHAPAQPGETWPSIALLVDDNLSPSRVPVISFQGERRLTARTTVGGEVNSNGSLFLRTHYQSRQFDAYGYYRAPSLDLSSGGFGANLSIPLAGGYSLSAGLSRSCQGSVQTDWRMLGLRVSIRPGVALDLEHSTTLSAATHGSVNAAMLTMPLGPLQFMARYENRQGAFAYPVLGSGYAAGVPESVWSGYMQRNLMFNAGLHPTRRMSFDWQAALHWTQDGKPVPWQALVSTFRLAARTKLQVVSDFPQIAAPERLHFRLEQTLDHDFSFTLDVGAAMASTHRRGNNGYSDPRGQQFADGREIFLALRHTLSANSEARGAEVSGHVQDVLGQPVRDVTVQLAAYRTTTDKNGKFIFRHVPAGTCRLGVDVASLPADYKTPDAGKVLLLTSRSRVMENVLVVPLRAISGSVFLDKNGNGIQDRGEGAGSIVLDLDGALTVTDSEGRFCFYNLEPGKHVVKLSSAQLPKDRAPGSAAQFEVTLPVDQSVSNVVFRLIRHEKKIEFQVIP